MGTLVRHWRVERRLSQQALSDLSSVSTRHVSRIETGLTNPSRTMLLTLAEHLDVPLRERNRILLAGGFAPAYADTSTQDPTLRGVMTAPTDAVLEGLHLETFLPADEATRAWLTAPDAGAVDAPR